MTKDWDNPRPLPIAKLSDVQHNGEGLLKASYQDEAFTLSPSMTLAEFRREVVRINKAIERVAIERGRFEAQSAKVAS